MPVVEEDILVVGMHWEDKLQEVILQEDIAEEDIPVVEDILVEDIVEEGMIVVAGEDILGVGKLVGEGKVGVVEAGMLAGEGIVLVAVVEEDNLEGDMLVGEGIVVVVGEDNLEEDMH